MDQPADIPLNPKVDAIIADITQLMNEAEQMLSDSTSHHAEPQIELLRSQHERESVRESFANFCATTGSAISDGARSTDRRIRTHPYQSLAIAVGAGVLLGMALARREG